MIRPLIRWRFLLIAIVVAYAIVPFFAGLLGAGDRDGPRIYFVRHHSFGYTLGYAMTHGGEKARSSMFRMRPFFYGMKPGWKPRPSNPSWAEEYDRVRSLEDAAKVRN